jgi:hypothetical protein
MGTLVVARRMHSHVKKGLTVPGKVKHEVPYLRSQVRNETKTCILHKICMQMFVGVS